MFNKIMWYRHSNNSRDKLKMTLLSTMNVNYDLKSVVTVLSSMMQLERVPRAFFHSVKS